ncbi:hypothetical protein QA596_12150 [Balneolales bacterium ANBcel1]|nr:hypothetical protein [Balneolales bacterium ANBcel1]
MGQQQLLLVILVVILVGIATVVAMNVFGGAAEDANRDAVRQDILQGATMAQAIYARPVMMDGAGGDFSNFSEADLLQRLGMPIVSGHNNCDDVTGTFGNENGCYSIGDLNDDSFDIIGVPASGGANIVATILYSDGEGTDGPDEGWHITWSDASVND